MTPQAQSADVNSVVDVMLLVSTETGQDSGRRSVADDQSGVRRTSAPGLTQRLSAVRSHEAGVHQVAQPIERATARPIDPNQNTWRVQGNVDSADQHVHCTGVQLHTL